MEYVIRFNWDNDAKVWYADNDYIPITLEHESLDKLMQRVREAIPELIELNKLEKPRFLYFLVEHREEVVA